MTKAEVWPLVRAQRDALGDLLAGLDDLEWGTPSLCRGWSVRDVAAHCAQSHVATPGRLAWELTAAGFRLDTRNQRWVTRRRQRSVAEVLDEYLATAGQSRVPASEARYALVEAVIHGYDIARPLRRSLTVPPRSLVITIETCRATGVFLHGRQRSAGLTLRATDTPWTAGHGPEVTGPIASLILAISGRATALADLAGDGLAILRASVARGTA